MCIDLCELCFFTVGIAFEQSPASITSEIGSDVRLQCQVDGFPTPYNIQWFHYNSVVGPTNSIQITDEMVNSTSIRSNLEISSLQTVQFGKYRCRANNTLYSQPAFISFTGTIYFSTSCCPQINDFFLYR